MEYDPEIKERQLQARSPEIPQALFGFLKAARIKPYPQHITESQNRNPRTKLFGVRRQLGWFDKFGALSSNFLFLRKTN